MSATLQQHIVFDELGRAIIAGTRTRVTEVMRDYVWHKWSPERIHRAYEYLSLAQIHAAFSYYFDNKAAVEEEIDAELREADELRKKLENPTLQAKLRALKARATKRKARARRPS